MSNVNFLKILKEEKQRILKLHENAGYKNSLNKKYLKEQSEEELRTLTQQAQAELRVFYEKFPDCVRFVTKGYPGSTTKLSNNKTGIYVIFKGKSSGVTFYPPLQDSNYGRYYDTISKKTNYYYCVGNTIKYGLPPNKTEKVNPETNKDEIDNNNSQAQQTTTQTNNSQEQTPANSAPDTNYISNTQTSLENAGFSVGSKGVDGRVGSDTLTAINQLISKYSELATKQ
jgi:hypothetical protein